MVQHQLSKGSILDFKGVEDIESISDFNSKLKGIFSAFSSHRQQP